MVGPIPDSLVVDPAYSRAFVVRPGLWQLRLPLAWPSVSSVNAFVLERADGGITLIDCGAGGHPSAHAALNTALVETGWSMADVRELVLTHHHSDHAGGEHAVVARSGCRVAGHPAIDHAVDPWRDPARVMAWRAALARGAGVPAELVSSFETLDEELDAFDRELVLDRELREGATVASALGDWEVLETPGHAPSHIVLWNAQEGAAIAGDVLARAFVPYVDLGYTVDPIGELRASIERVRGLDPVLACVGHGRTVDSVQATADDHISQIDAALESCRGAVRDLGEASCHDVVRQLHLAPMDPFALVWRLWLTQAYLSHLVEAGALDGAPGSDGVLGYRLS